MGPTPFPVAVTVALAAPAAAGAMLATEKFKGNWPLATAFFIRPSAARASIRPIPPSTRLLFAANGTLGSASPYSTP